MDSTVIKIQDAVVSYREDLALRGVSLEVRKGEFIGIIGPNGAGKTTLLTVINGLGRLVRGEVRLLGSRLNGSNSSSLRKRIGYVAQVENIGSQVAHQCQGDGNGRPLRPPGTISSADAGSMGDSR